MTKEQTNRRTQNQSTRSRALSKNEVRVAKRLLKGVSLSRYSPVAACCQMQLVLRLGELFWFVCICGATGNFRTYWRHSNIQGLNPGRAFVRLLHDISHLFEAKR